MEDFFESQFKAGKAVVELYEQVQSCGNVLPRLYLLITVGAVYIKSQQAPATDILKDLVEMTKGVQVRATTLLLLRCCYRCYIPSRHGLLLTPRYYTNY